MLCVLAALTVATRADARHSQFHGKRLGNQAWQYKWQVWLPDKHRRVTTCETPITVNGHREMNWRHNSGTYQGAYGFHYDSWDQFKPVRWWPSEAYLATPWQQYQTALAIYRRYGWSGWGCRGA